MALSYQKPGVWSKQTGPAGFSVQIKKGPPLSDAAPHLNFLTLRFRQFFGTDNRSVFIFQCKQLRFLVFVYLEELSG
jgi:hypothetical protein